MCFRRLYMDRARHFNSNLKLQLGYQECIDKLWAGSSQKSKWTRRDLLNANFIWMRPLHTPCSHTSRTWQLGYVWFFLWKSLIFKINTPSSCLALLISQILRMIQLQKSKWQMLLMLTVDITKALLFFAALIHRLPQNIAEIWYQNVHCLIPVCVSFFCFLWI